MRRLLDVQIHKGPGRVARGLRLRPRYAVHFQAVILLKSFGRCTRAGPVDAVNGTAVISQIIQPGLNTSKALDGIQVAQF